MRIRVRLTGATAAAVASLAWNGATIAAEAVTKPIDPAHALAQKFAGGGDSTTLPQAVSRPKAKSDPEVAPKPLAGTATDKPAAAKPATANAAPPPVAKIGPQRPSLDYEMEMLRRARVEESERKSKAMEALAAAAAASAPKVAETPAAPETANSTLATAPAPAVAAQPTPAVIKAVEKPSSLTEPAALSPPAKVVAPFAATVAVPAPLATVTPNAPERVEKPANADAPPTIAAVTAVASPIPALKAAEITPRVAPIAPVQEAPSPIAPPAAPTPQLKELKLIPALPLAAVAATAVADAKPTPATPPGLPTTLSAAPTTVPQPPTEQATVLLVLEADSAVHDATRSMHDPIVCFDDVCIVSNGFDNAAKALPRRDAQALTTSTGITLDTCRGKSACVFRDVAITAAPRLQVIDLGGDKTSNAGGGYTTEVDKSCRMSDGELTCDHPLATPDFRVWIVPEAIAKKAGIAALEDAIVEGLPQGELVSSADK